MEKGDLSLLTLEEEITADEPLEDALEAMKMQEDHNDSEFSDNGEEKALYDKELFQNELIEEDVDFDW